MIARYAGGALGARNAARAGSPVVVVDTFRASTTVAVLVSKGAGVLPVASIEEARAAEADFRIGERGSMKVAGFDFGNSPTEVRAAEIPPAPPSPSAPPTEPASSKPPPARRPS